MPKLSSGLGPADPADSEIAVVPDLPPDLTATRRKALHAIIRGHGRPGRYNCGADCTRSHCVVPSISAIVCSGGAFSVSVLALVHGYALVVLTRRGAC